MSDAEIQRQDGRRRRRDSNRQMILDALLNLYSEGEIEPTAQQVADAAGVSRRTVFGLFQDLDSLMEELVERHLERHQSTGGLPEPQGNLQERIERAVQRRDVHFERVQVVQKALRRAGHRYPMLQERLEKTRERLQSRLRTYFAEEFAALSEEVQADLMAALLVQLGYDTWHKLANVLLLEREQRIRIQRMSLEGLFHQAYVNSRS